MISLLLGAAAPAAKAGAAAAAPIKAPAGNVPAVPPTQVNPVVTPENLTWFQQHAGWLTHTLGALFIVAALALIALLAVQTTKQEGLSGTLGGRVESAYGRPGAEEQIKRITGVVAVAFVVIGTILSLTGI